MAADDSRTLVLPIGQLNGLTYVDPGSDEHSVVVRRGAEFLDLDDEQFAIWGRAHGSVDDAGGRSHTRAELAAAVGEHVAEPDRVLDGLLAEQLLVELAPGTEAARAFAAEHRLVPLMLGLGNSAEDLGASYLGLFDQPVVNLSPGLFELVAWGHLDPDLWVAVQSVATVGREAGVTDPVTTDPESLLLALLGQLHALLTPNAAYLDVRRGA
jgi:hypothetical protein